MQVKTISRFHLIPDRMAVTSKQMTRNADGDGGKKPLCTRTALMKISTIQLQNFWMCT